MKKIILVSLVFGLITNAAFATYYKTTTSNCSDAAMLAELDKATALHRAVVTDVTCEYTAPRVVQKAAPAPAPVQTFRPTRFVKYPVADAQPVRTPKAFLVTVTKETCTCDDCGC